MYSYCSLLIFTRLDRDYDDGSGDGVSGFVTTSVVFALLIFLKFRNSINDCLQYSISAGGDTDSTTAMVAAFCGAFLGHQRLLDAIPDGLSVVTDKSTWNYKELTQLASDVWKIRFSK
jgi:ADP-ribosylglycohydrolase